jgi:hypothetical protein
MWNAATVLVCALDLLGRSAATFPPIILLAERPPDVSHIAEAFTRQGARAIYVLTSSNTFRSIQHNAYRCGDVDAVRKLASILIHEEHHIRHGPSEREAYQAQLSTLVRLGAPPGSPAFSSVARSMKMVLAAQ